MSELYKVAEEDCVKWLNKEGKLHRVDGPAIEWSSGTKEWWFKGRLHREDGPAVDKQSGTKEWWFDGKRHRVGGPAIEWCTGKKEWYCNGSLHRLDGPAIEYNGGNQWYLKGIFYSSKEKWFNALPEEEQLTYLFNME